MGRPLTQDFAASSSGGPDLRLPTEGEESVLSAADAVHIARLRRALLPEAGLPWQVGEDGTDV